MNEETTIDNRNILSLISELCQIVRFCRQDAVFCEDVTFTQFLILDSVAQTGTLNMSELRRVLAVDKSTATRLADPLVRQKMIERSRSKQDSRAVILELTSTGEDVHRKVWECLKGFFDAVSVGIQEDERAQVYNAVKVFMRAVKNASSACPCCDRPPLEETI